MEISTTRLRVSIYVGSRIRSGHPMCSGVLYLREILRDFHETQQSPTLVFEDNLACIAMSENAVRHKYSRLIDIRRYFVRELVADGVLKLVPLRTHLMMADALTKSLLTPTHAKHRAVMMGHAPFSARVFQVQAG